MLRSVAITEAREGHGDHTTMRSTKHRITEDGAAAAALVKRFRYSAGDVPPSTDGYEGGLFADDATPDPDDRICMYMNITNRSETRILHRMIVQELDSVEESFKTKVPYHTDGVWDWIASGSMKRGEDKCVWDVLTVRCPSGVACAPPHLLDLPRRVESSPCSGTRHM